MNKELFWKMINKAREESGGVMNDSYYAEIGTSFCDYLERELAQLGDSDIIEWQQIYNVYLYLNVELHHKLWAAAHFINGYCSDYGFEHFKNWLIASGKSVYMKAINDPDDLA